MMDLINSIQKYLKFPQGVILNHTLNSFHGLFQDLTLRTPPLRD